MLVWGEHARTPARLPLELVPAQLQQLERPGLARPHARLAPRQPLPQHRVEDGPRGDRRHPRRREGHDGRLSERVAALHVAREVAGHDGAVARVDVRHRRCVESLRGVGHGSGEDFCSGRRVQREGRGAKGQRRRRGLRGAGEAGRRLGPRSSAPSACGVTQAQGGGPEGGPHSRRRCRRRSSRGDGGACSRSALRGGRV